MNRKKIRLGILFGGTSAEHEVSLISAKNVIEALDQQKYDLFLIGIDKSGEWLLRDRSSYLANANDLKLVHLDGAKEGVALLLKQNQKEIVSYQRSQLHQSLNLDVIFPVLHGTFGEDGTVQGLLKLAGIPFVGSGILGSAIGMDKDVMKRLLRDAEIPVARFLTVHQYNRDQFTFEAVVQKVGLPFFVKPANAGSSIGINKVKEKEKYFDALAEAFLYDRKVIIEEFISGKEVECSVLGNDSPIVSLPGEVIPQHEFYSYEAKYLDADGAHFQIPASLPPQVVAAAKEMAIKAYRAICCEGMARVDFFLKENGDLLVNEINTIPGFTSISMYPKLWEVSGISYSELLDKLVELAIERHQQELQLKTNLTLSYTL